MTQPLWPQPIPILGLTGEYQSGKTWFGISICPDPKRLRVYDLEMSAEPYKSLGFDHVNVPRLMLSKYPRGYKPIDVWNWWLDDINELEPGRFDAILVDPVTDLERGLTDWVQANPAAFGHTAGQYASMTGIMWGDVKDYWKLILTGRAATKCQTFAFVAHLGDEVKNKQFTGKRAPKGKDTLIELATLYLHLEREKDRAGNRPSVPSAMVLKSRLSHLGMGDDGPSIREALPPRLPRATPKAIRAYLENPPDMENLKPEERAVERTMTDDERLRLQAQIAEASREAAMARAAVERPALSAYAEPPRRAARPTAQPARTTAEVVAGHEAALDAARSVGEANAAAARVKADHRNGLLDDAAYAGLGDRYKTRHAALKAATAAAA